MGKGGLGGWLAGYKQSGIYTGNGNIIRIRWFQSYCSDDEWSWIIERLGTVRFHSLDIICMLSYTVNCVFRTHGQLLGKTRVDIIWWFFWTDINNWLLYRRAPLGLSTHTRRRRRRSLLQFSQELNTKPCYTKHARQCVCVCVCLSECGQWHDERKCSSFPWSAHSIDHLLNLTTRREDTQ